MARGQNPLAQIEGCMRLPWISFAEVPTGMKSLTQGGISITAAADGVTTVESTGCEVFVRSTLNPLPAGVLLERHSETPCLFCDGSDFS